MFGCRYWRNTSKLLICEFVKLSFLRLMCGCNRQHTTDYSRCLDRHSCSASCISLQSEEMTYQPKIRGNHRITHFPTASINSRQNELMSVRAIETEISRTTKCASVKFMNFYLYVALRCDQLFETLRITGVE